MKRVLGLIAISVSTEVLAADLPVIESQVYEAPGQVVEIAGRVRLCAIKLLRNDPIQLNDATTTSLLGPSSIKPATSAPGNDVISMADIEGGTIVVRYRFPFKWALVSHVGEAMTTIMIKDGRFKMETTGLQAAQLSTGYSANDGFSPLRDKSPHLKKFTAALEEQQAKLVACIQTTNKGDW